MGFNNSLTWFQWNLLEMAGRRKYPTWSCPKERIDEYLELEKQKLVIREKSLYYSNYHIFFALTKAGIDKLAKRWQHE